MTTIPAIYIVVNALIGLNSGYSVFTIVTVNDENSVISAVNSKSVWVTLVIIYNSGVLVDVIVRKIELHSMGKIVSNSVHDKFTVSYESDGTLKVCTNFTN